MDTVMTNAILLKTLDGVEANVTGVLADHPAFVIGSDSRADFHLTEKGVQPAHAVITRRDADYLITPRTSTAEVRLNGKPLRFPTRLNMGDTLHLGTVTLTVEQGKWTTVPVAPPVPKPAILPVGYIAPKSVALVDSAVSPVVISPTRLSAQPREIYYPKPASSGGIRTSALLSGLVTLVVVAFVIGYGLFSSSPVTAANVTSQYAFNDGHVTVVMFEASWCTFCKVQKPLLNELASEYRGKVYNQFLDAEASANSEMVKAFNVSAYPVTLVFNDQGQVVSKFLGLTDSRIIRQAIEQALRESGQQT